VHRPTIAILLAAVAFAASVSCLIAARRPGMRYDGRAQRTWTLAGLAILAWLIGDVFWVMDIYSLDGFHVDAPVGEVSYAVGALLMAAVVVGLARGRVAGKAWLQLLLDGSLVAGSCFVLAWTWLLGAAAEDSEKPEIIVVAAVTFPIFDLLLFGLVIGLWRRSPAGARAPATLVLLSLALKSGTDIAYAFVAVSGDYKPGGLIDAGWVLSCVVLAAAPWAGRSDLLGTHEPRAFSVAEAVVPAVVTAGCAMAVVADAALGSRGPNEVALVVTGVVVVVLVARQAMTLVENVMLSRELADREDHYRSLVQSSNDVIMIMDSDGVVRYVSPAVERVYGYATDSVVGHRVTRLVHPHDQDGVVDRLRRFLVDDTALLRLQCRVRAADGTWRHTESAVSHHDDGFILNGRDVSERVELQEKLARYAYHDVLTGLPNRALFSERIALALEAPALGEEPRELAVLFLDLDGFKAVNDSSGHAAGDQLLIAAARRLTRACRPGDTVARFGGDEFAVLLDRDGTAPAAVEIGRRMVAALAEPYQLGETEVAIAASIGIAFATPGAGADELMRNADLAMYRAKSQGKGQVQVYEPGMHADAVARLELDNRLRRALLERQLTLLYQPVVDLQTGVVSGVEALIRWHAGDGQLLTPAELIAYAEDSGRIVPLGRWVIEEAVRQAAEWQRAGSPLSVAVNLSARQISTPGLFEAIQGALLDSGLLPQSLTLEITESVLIEDVEGTIERLELLRGLGVRLAIDDFGTGYSSLAYLRRLPVDVLKIDRSFVSGLGLHHDVTSLTRTIVRLGRDLGLVLVAEGVETVEQMNQLRGMGCHRAQGFYFSGPLDVATLQEVVGRGPFRVEGLEAVPAVASAGVTVVDLADARKRLANAPLPREPMSGETCPDGETAVPPR
jgi:diguanylate cyclase (GGDEF)-like protein/PAS domain S-box-containing protein